MRITLDAVAKGRALPPISLVFETGRAVLACAETEQRPTVLGLIASGRMRPAAGAVTIDSRTDAGAIRRGVALVDAPDVSAPEPDVALVGVAAEELMFAGRRSDPRAARRWVEGLGLGGSASHPISTLAPADRVRLLCELALLRPGVEGLVLVSPDRHGGDPVEWWALAEEFAARGNAVLVIAGESAAAVLADRASRAEDVEEPEEEPEPEAEEEPEAQAPEDAEPEDSEPEDQEEEAAL